MEKRPEPPLPRPEPPESLTETSRELWRSIVPGRVSPGRLKLFEQAFLCLDRLEQVRGILATTELTTVTPRTGAVHVHPLLKTETDLRRQFWSLWDGLGIKWNTRIDGATVAAYLGGE